MSEYRDVWRPVLGYEGLYEASSGGSIRRVGQAARTGNGHGGGVRIGHILAARYSQSGYLLVQLWKMGKPKTHPVHRLVLSAFMGPPPEGHEINHRDGDKANNALWNLEYCTRSENVRHAYKMGLRKTIPGAHTAKRQRRRTVRCACGCGFGLETPDEKGRRRRFISGHNTRARQQESPSPTSNTA